MRWSGTNRPSTRRCFFRRDEVWLFAVQRDCDRGDQIAKKGVEPVTFDPFAFAATFHPSTSDRQAKVPVYSARSSTAEDPSSVEDRSEAADRSAAEVGSVSADRTGAADHCVSEEDRTGALSPVRRLSRDALSSADRNAADGSVPPAVVSPEAKQPSADPCATERSGPGCRRYSQSDVRQLQSFSMRDPLQARP